MTHRLVLRLAKIVIFPLFREKQASFVVFASLKGRVCGKGRTERGQRCPHRRLHTNDFKELLYVASRTLRDHSIFNELLHISIGNKNSANPTQNPTFSLYLADSPRVAMCRVWSKNPTQTLHGTLHGNKETKRRGLPQPLPKGKGFVAALMHRTWGSFLGESKRRREGEWERGGLRKTMGRLRKTMGRERKTMGRLGKI